MRIRFTCDTCDYKTTSKTMLILHKSSNHQTKATKWKSCDICDKKFNKESTFKSHMKKEHRQSQIMEGQK